MMNRPAARGRDSPDGCGNLTTVNLSGRMRHTGGGGLALGDPGELCHPVIIPSLPVSGQPAHCSRDYHHGDRLSGLRGRCQGEPSSAARVINCSAVSCAMNCFAGLKQAADNNIIQFFILLLLIFFLEILSIMLFFIYQDEMHKTFPIRILVFEPIRRRVKPNMGPARADSVHPVRREQMRKHRSHRCICDLQALSDTGSDTPRTSASAGISDLQVPFAKKKKRGPV
ncbi:hypothetical protein F2P81_004229 [Scophthalmus maximus]|uniref:Uncharacterized protein n=1 Tax=Scophthalmus maximus TaxID=52904 RepID=A0A6A4TLL8_SCOMX|nr:hypothetical protein F2P81_004229 [Scophthalmus maximus]